MEIKEGIVVKAVGAHARSHRGAYRVEKVDSYCVYLRSLETGRVLYFGPKTFWQYWKPVYNGSEI